MASSERPGARPAGPAVPGPTLTPASPDTAVPALSTAPGGHSSEARSPALDQAEAPPPLVVLDPTAAAFFDVDNTMMSGASIFHFARGLAERKFFSTRDVLGFAVHQLQFLASGESSNSMQAAKQSALAFVAERSVQEVVGLCEEIWAETMSHKIYAGTLAMAQAHLLRGERVWLVTATPQELAEIIARHLGLSGAIGTVAEVVDGRYTGRLVGDLLHGPGKVEAVKHLAYREGLDLSRCSAYSDSANDVPLLTLVGHPHAVNPDDKLKRIAREQGWPVHDFRTGRRAAKIGISSAAASGATVGLAVAAIAVIRHTSRSARG